MIDLHGKVAVISGGNRGIGRAIALTMAGAGAAVAISARSEESLQQVGDELEARGARWLAIPCDVSDQASVEAMGDAVLHRFGSVHIVVANAGIAGPTKPMHEISLEEWRECVAIDLDGVYLTFRRFIPQMIESRQGCLIAVSSITGKRPLRYRTPYAAAKMGVIGLVRTLAVELGPFGIRVNTVCPGAVAGPRLTAVFEAQARAQGVSLQEVERQFTDPSALKRAVREDEIASTCLFLASEDASAITGEDINVAAGLVMY